MAPTAGNRACSPPLSGSYTNLTNWRGSTYTQREKGCCRIAQTSVHGTRLRCSRMEWNHQVGGEGQEESDTLEGCKNSSALILEQKGEPYDRESFGKRDETGDRVTGDRGWAARQSANVPRHA